jgi:hypothetical protein
LGRKAFPGCNLIVWVILADSLQINIENRHRAGGDAAVKLFEHMLANGARLILIDVENLQNICH